ncbi:hypothetical protein C0Q70_10449 [Pomacea canaliculata]|uniref:Uncharacterized protein n=2 Tax=Pomacea canaliculata TaxID=400727 RepID=A0A2T7P377_POMCA|nr:hypothetical protein C0Q70_10449 [Pomacea canaliculata]
MRLRRSKQKSSLSARRRWPKEEDKDSHSTSSQPLHKRRNPFRCDSPSKRLCAHLDNKENSPVPASASDDEDIVCSDSESEHSQHKLVLALSSVDQNFHSGSRKRLQVVKKEHCAQTESGKLSLLLAEVTSQDHVVQTDGFHKEVDSLEHMTKGLVPVDWSIKTKVRILIENATIPISIPSSFVEAKSHMDFVCNAPLDSVGAEGLVNNLKRVCNYWVHPSLPWFASFPRISQDLKNRKHVAVDAGHSELMQKALHEDWMESFTAVFQQLKTGLCPYFYVCGHLFTALFRAAGVGGHPCITACLTPTTRGFREALRREGVDFSMPNLTSLKQFADKSKKLSEYKANLQASPETPEVESCIQPSTESNEGSTVEDNQVDITSTDEGAQLWLEDLGVDRKSFPSLDPSKVRMQREGYQQVDLRAQSLMLCQGPQVQAFFNFLINCRSCTALTGPQAGIPPTILSPTSFSGATVHSNKIRHSVAKMSTGSRSQDTHVLDIGGPLLPHHLLNITALTPVAIGGSAIISHSTHNPTVPFNMNAVTESDVALPMPDDRLLQHWMCTLHSSVRHKLLEVTSLSCKTAVREVKCDPQGFKWTT